MFWEAAAAEDYGSVSVAPTPISMDASIGPTYFVVWIAQGPAEDKKIRTIYSTFVAREEESVCELLR